MSEAIEGLPVERLVGRFSDEEYLRFDPFEGDRDVDIRNHIVKMVTTRKPHTCAMPTGPMESQHTIPAGSRVRYESAIVDGEWGSYHVCTACMDRWLIDECGMTPNAQAQPTF